MTVSRWGAFASRKGVRGLTQGLWIISLGAVSGVTWATKPVPAGDIGEQPIAPAAAAPAAAPAAAASTSSAPQTQLQQVDVTGQATGGNQPPPAYAGGQVATGGRLGVLGEQNAADVPFSVISYTAQLIDNQQADTLADVLFNDAAVQSGFGFGNYSEQFQVRGFTLAGEDISFGGLYSVLPRQIVQTNFVERVEVFKGSNAFANGIPPSGSGVGGSINLEPKRATDKPITEFKLGYASDSQILESLDLGRRFGPEQRFGARLNVQHEKGDTAISDENTADTSIGLGLDYRGDRARASLDFGYQRQHIKHGRNVVYINKNTGQPSPTATIDRVPSPPDNSINYAPSYASTELDSIFGMIRGEYDITDQWTGYAAVGGNTSDEQGQYGSPALINDQGDATVSRLGVPFEAHSFTGQAGLRGDIDTGPISHKINLGYSGFYRRTSTAYTLSTGVPTSIYDPASVGFLPTAFTDGDLDDPNVRSRTRTDGWALSDTAGFFDDRLLVTAGGRYQSVTISNYDYQGDQDGASITGNTVSPLYGVVYKPTNWSSLYYNHIEGLSPGDAAPTGAPGGGAVSNAGQVIGLVQSKQDEVGAKLDFGRIGGTLALYQIKRPSAYVDPNTLDYGYFGDQRNRGIELNAYGEPVDGLRLTASATWIDPELRGTANGTFDGNDEVGVPDYRLVFTGDWTLPSAPKWAINARVIHNGTQYADRANQLQLPAWTRVDMGLRYEMPWSVGEQITWRANVENVADSDYWQSAEYGAFQNYLTQSRPRTFRLSATFAFD